jgi:transposase
VEHIAIDLGGSQSQVCVRDANGQILLERKHHTGALGSWLKKRPVSRVIVETSAEAFRVADQALACGHEVRVVPATLVKSLGVGSRGVKNDQRDARILSEVSCRIDLPSVHVPSELSRELKSMCGSREALVATRTKLINNVRGWLRTQLWRVRSGGTASFPSRVRAHVQASGHVVPEHIERGLRVLDLLNDQVADADRQVKRVATEHEICRRLMTVPGVGPVTAVRFVAALDQRERFGSAHAVQAYLGLTPGEHSSSERERRTGITKAGSRQVRYALVQAAWCALRTRPGDAMVRWAVAIGLRRGRFVAVVALARKLAGVLYAIWRDGSSYAPRQGAEEEHLVRS